MNMWYSLPVSRSWHIAAWALVEHHPILVGILQPTAVTSSTSRRTDFLVVRWQIIITIQGPILVEKKKTAKKARNPSKIDPRPPACQVWMNQKHLTSTWWFGEMDYDTTRTRWSMRRHLSRWSSAISLSASNSFAGFYDAVDYIENGLLLFWILGNDDYLRFSFVRQYHISEESVDPNSNAIESGFHESRHQWDDVLVLIAGFE